PPVTLAAGATSQQIYQAAGPYTVNLTATDAAGPHLTATRSITVGAGLTPTPTPNPTAPDFTLVLVPSSQVLAPGGSASLVISLGSVSGFAQSVSLTVGSLPTGVTASFAPDTVTPSGATTLFLAATSNATTGS